MADKKISALSDLGSAIAVGDYLHVIDDPAGTPVNKRVNYEKVVPVAFNSLETLTADGTLSATTTVSLLDSTSATCQTILGSGSVTGQIKIVICSGYSNACDVDYATSVGGGVTVTFQAVSESVTLLWTGAAWAPIAFGSNTVASDVVGTQDIT